MDQEVIRSLKAKCRRRAVQRMIDEIDKEKEITKISILNAMKYLVQSWESVSSQTIVNCFSKAGFTAENVDSDLEDDPFRDLVSTIDELRLVDASQVPEDVTPQDLLSMDE